MLLGTQDAKANYTHICEEFVAPQETPGSRARKGKSKQSSVYAPVRFGEMGLKHVSSLEVMHMLSTPLLAKVTK